MDTFSPAATHRQTLGDSLDNPALPQHTRHVSCPAITHAGTTKNVFFEILKELEKDSASIHYSNFNYLNRNLSLGVYLSQAFLKKQPNYMEPNYFGKYFFGDINILRRKKGCFTFCIGRYA